MPLHLYNTLTRQKELFEPNTPNHVDLYMCGPTVYDDAHLGHARCYVAWDVLIRAMRYMGYTVNNARNLTDVDDKILNRARENNVPFGKWAKRYTQRFHEDMAALNVAPPTHEPKATEHIEDIINGCQVLIDNGHAYATDAGNVYYRTSAKADYGKLSKKPLDDLKTGARVEGETDKESPLDFALWKATPSDDTDSWAAPFGGSGKGRPGWHMECSAMNHRLFKGQLDIHTGGADLTFPHHENEIAQSEAWSGCQPYAKYWLHNGFVTVDNDKMSKSLGNFATIRDLLQKYNADTLRHFLLTHHYRMPVDFTPEALDGAANRVEKIHRSLKKAADALELVPDVLAEFDALAHNSNDPTVVQFVAALNDDINTPRALAAMDEAIQHLNTTLQTNGNNPAIVRDAFWPVWTCYTVLGYTTAGIFSGDTLPTSLKQPLQLLATQLGITPKKTIEAMLQAIIEHRSTAKANKDWATSDNIRSSLASQGVTLEDSKDGTTWSYKAPATMVTG